MSAADQQQTTWSSCADQRCRLGVGGRGSVRIAAERQHRLRFYFTWRLNRHKCEIRIPRGAFELHPRKPAHGKEDNKAKASSKAGSAGWWPTNSLYAAATPCLLIEESYRVFASSENCGIFGFRLIVHWRHLGSSHGDVAATTRRTQRCPLMAA